LAVLTSIELEHTDVFGKSLKRIVYEKCGIVINEVPVVVAPQNNLVRKLIKTELKGRKSKMFFTDEISIPKINVDFENLVHEDNAKVVYLSLKTLLNEVDMKVFKNVLSVFKFEGRFDVRKVNGKTVVFDIAHTENSMRNLVNSLAKKFPKKDFLFLFSVMIGKNVSAMLDEILKISDEIVFTRSHKIRGYEAKELFGKYSKIFQKSSFMEDPFMAYASLLKKVSKNRILVVTGSHFLVGKIFSKIK
jgi:dihydrofolate synthase/folylpolyglutamate synthase